MKHEDWKEKVDRQIQEFSELIGSEARDAFEGQCSDAAYASKDSPIEKLMGAALFYAINSTSWYGEEARNSNYCYGYPIPDDILRNVPPSYGISVFPQAKVGKYRADFLIQFAHFRGGYVWGAIECDGHDYHDLTKHQAIRDRARDRDFQDRGVLILRYTGSEIWRAPLKCATDALGLLERRSTDPTALLWKAD